MKRNKQVIIEMLRQCEERHVAGSDFYINCNSIAVEYKLTLQEVLEHLRLAETAGFLVRKGQYEPGEHNCDRQLVEMSWAGYDFLEKE